MMPTRAPMKRTEMRRAAAPAKKELNRDQRLAVRAQRAIKNAPPRAAVEKSENLRQSHAVPAPLASNFVASFAKEQQHRNPRLLAMAEKMPCLLRIPGTCNRDPDTTVACHSNWRQHGGKGAHRKADDHYSCWGCGACHHWLDFGPAPKAAKQMAFLAAHADQVLLWRQIAADSRRPPADRKAAKWALDLLNATPNAAVVHDTCAQAAIN